MKGSKLRTQDIFKSRILIARIMLYLNMLLWLINGAALVYQMIQDENTWIVVLVVLLFLLALGSLYTITRIIDQPETWVYPTILVLLAVNLGMTFVGYPDFLFILCTIMNVLITVNFIPLKNYYTN